MRLFWKVFLALMLTLLLTAAMSTWLSQKWLLENQAIEMRLMTLASLGETAVSLYEQESPADYHRWLRHTMRSQQFRGTLIDATGRPVLSRPLPPQLQRLAKQVATQQKRITIMKPPLLAVATPVQSESKHYYWIASSHLSPEHMREEIYMRIAIVLLAIGIVSWLLTRMFTRPIRQLQQRTVLLGQGSLTTRSPADIATRKDELGDLGRSFDAMAAQLDALINSHKQLLRDISHELRSPLARMQVALELARNEAGGKADAELDRIGLEAERLNELIGEVLTLARFEEGAVQVGMSRLKLDDMLRDIAADAAFEAEPEGKSVSCHALAACYVSADKLWLGRALDNVIRNAIRHENSGSCVEITLTLLEKIACITVRDHGNGVDEAKLAHLFDPFFRASEAREHDNSGYGLGLAIARRAVEMHAGSIVARNHTDGGLQVEITLPVVA
ncbi:MAG: two-component sensor histidine kinase [Zetaproteobacteria bacterium CG12_big_fil_rev_8_21_14_0_65_54_13]|nr:MAG: two-component sensor histidine kinase [Zetaproteobacteria bacterium CG12_big_fil_rev_8_21_14_0_65_54_13]PIX54726.1 MAG: two-component sensor histidine kinase [Zetaproteobacteria bacterium CG_4_10_14_3_um_filter_54_28]PJA29366.1 MAG: two-component sensor histidine kinase [Zetaproteobacteria bacterium CG_4_9_14_3_um_filter_54_145]